MTGEPKVTWAPEGEEVFPKTNLSDPHSVGFREIPDEPADDDGEGMSPEEIRAFMARPIEPRGGQ